jgi:FkbM family methyltransferase
MFGGFCVPKSSFHRPAAKAVMSGKVWEPDTIEFIINHCRDGDIVHAGTFFGDFLPALSKGAAPGAKVWAFEPNRESFRCAKITNEINDLRNISLANCGLGAKSEQRYLQTADKEGRALGGASWIADEGRPERLNGEHVQMVTIDDTIGKDRNVSIIQLDVEGHEEEALSGALETIRRCLPILIIEVIPKSRFLQSNWFAENIRILGYQRFEKVHSNYVFACDTTA